MLPENFKSGERARLFPVVAETSKERRVASITLAVLSKVPELSRRLFATAKVKIGKTARIKVFTEIVVDDNSGDRPDGLVTVSVGKKVWRAFIEAKIGNAKLDDDQVKRYAELAREHQIDAIITISNQFTVRADHHPTTQLSKSLSKKVTLYHWPWMWIRTQAELIELDGTVNDEEQQFLLREFIRFMKHPSTGIDKFTQMPKEWKPLVSFVRDGGTLRKTSEQVEAVVSAWQQEVRDLALDMSRHIGRKVDIKLSAKQRASAAEWLKNGCAELANTRTLSCVLLIPDTAGPMLVAANIALRTITCSIRMIAPKNKKGTKARINWLVRQLKKSEAAEIQIKAIRAGSASNNIVNIKELRENPAAIEISHPDNVPTAFEVMLTRDLAGRFTASKKIIEEIESAVPAFYDQAGQYLKPWHPAPPPPISKPESFTSAPDQPVKDNDEKTGT